MKNPNGYGSVYKLSGKRRKPWVAAVTTGWTIDTSYGRIKQLRTPIGYYPTRQDAMQALALYNENPYNLDAQRVTIEMLYEKWSDEYFQELTDESSIRTVKSAWSYVTPTFRSQNAIKMTAQGLKTFITNDAQRIDNGKILKPSDNIKSRMKSMFNLMYDYAVLADLTDQNPARAFSLKGIQAKIEKNRKDKVPIILEHEQALWDDIDFGYTRMVIINIYSGWRPEELVELTKDNIDLTNMTITGGMKTDAGTDRTIPIHPKILPLIEYYYYKSNGELLFYDYDKVTPTRMTYDKYRGRFKKILLRHGWSELYTPSCPRHTFATKAQKAKMDDYARKMIMGHELTDVTYKHYTHLDTFDMHAFLMDEIQKIV